VNGAQPKTRVPYQTAPYRASEHSDRYRDLTMPVVLSNSLDHGVCTLQRRRTVVQCWEREGGARVPKVDRSVYAGPREGYKRER
jgi:hypothetical protein